jgi:cell division inhibitor SulA
MGLTSTFTEGPPQADGRWFVSETHSLPDGQAYTYEWLSDGSLNPQLVMEERAVVIAATLAAREAARAAVVGTSVPLTRFEFLDRFTTAERVGIREAAKTNPVVEDFMEMMKLSGNVSLVLARPGLQYLAAIGKLTAPRAAAIGAE